METCIVSCCKGIQDATISRQVDVDHLSLLPFILLVSNSNNINTTKVLTEIFNSSSHVISSPMYEYSMLYTYYGEKFCLDVMTLT
jgi:hypothetical protein